MDDEQIRLYAACRVACPSGMIRLRSTTDELGRFCVIATRPPFKRPARRPAQIAAALEAGDIRPADPLPVESYPAERAGIGIHPSLFWGYDDDGIYAALAERFAESIARGFRRATLDVRL